MNNSSRDPVKGVFNFYSILLLRTRLEEVEAARGQDSDAAIDLECLSRKDRKCKRITTVPPSSPVQSGLHETSSPSLVSQESASIDDPDAMGDEHFQPGHKDRVTTVDTNFDSTKLLTGSIDHTIKVFNLNPGTDEHTLFETFTAHHARIIEAKFTEPGIGSYIGTLGDDLTFKIWEEDKSQAPNSGRRYKPIGTIPATSGVSFASFDFKTIKGVYIYLTIISRQGLLSIYEPSDPDSLKEWTLLDQFNVCSKVPSRGDETSFKVRFDPNLTPLPFYHSLSDDEDMLGILVTGLKDVKLYLSTTEPDAAPTQPSQNGASHRLTFHEVLQLPTHPSLVRDIAWAPGNIRSSERFATACKDGHVRVYEVECNERGEGDRPNNPAVAQRGEKVISRNRPPQQSSLTSAITGRASTNVENETKPAKSHTFEFRYEVKKAWTVASNDDVWQVEWDRQGRTLTSSGTDGITKMFRQDIHTGDWIKAAEHSVEQENDEEQD